MDQAQTQSVEERAFNKLTGFQFEKKEPKKETEASAEPQAEVAAVETEVEPSDQALEQSQEAQQVTETEEVEFDDFKLELPKDRAQKVREALMRNADYTKKSQATAERERALSAREQAFQAQTQFHQQAMDDIASIKAYDNQLAQFNQVQWNQLGTEDLMRTKLYYDQVKEARQKAVDGLQEKHRNFQRQLDEHMKQLENSSHQEVILKIPGFKEKDKETLKRFAIENGYTEQQASRMFLSPADVLMVWRAQQYAALQASKPGVQNRANNAPPVIRPGASTKPMSQETKDILALRKETDPRKKEKIGADILFNKMKLG